jgi:hypothetical protein
MSCRKKQDARDCAVPWRRWEGVAVTFDGCGEIAPGERPGVVPKLRRNNATEAPRLSLPGSSCAVAQAFDRFTQIASGAAIEGLFVGNREVPVV